MAVNTEGNRAEGRTADDATESGLPSYEIPGDLYARTYEMSVPQYALDLIRRARGEREGLPVPADGAPQLVSATV